MYTAVKKEKRREEKKNVQNARQTLLFEL